MFPLFLAQLHGNITTVSVQLQYCKAVTIKELHTNSDVIRL